MKKICLLLSLLFVLIACSETNENADVASDQKLTNSTQTATTAEQSSELDFSNQANLIDAIDEMYDWQSYKSDYSFQYIVEGIEHFNIIETEYIVEPKQKHTFISTPYFEEEYYAIENDGVYSYKDYTEQWEFDENTDVSLENDIYYSQMLLRLIVENSLENTTVQDTSGPVIVNMILQEENLKKKFEYFLSARYELLDDVLYAKVKDITSGSALIYYDDGQMSRYEISLDILFIDETKGVLEIKEQFGEVNGLTEIIVPEETYVNAIN